MKNVLFALMTAIVLVATGCAHRQPQLANVEPITLPGTGDSQDLLRALATSYTERYPERQVVVPDSIGSGGGIKAVGTGASPVGRVARFPNAKEKGKYGSFQYMEFARVPVAFVIDSASGVKNLSAQQVCDIYSGRITNWKTVGGKDLPIAVQARPDQGSNMQTIRKHIGCFKALQVTDKAHFNLRNSNLVDSMKMHVGAIGFMPLSEADHHGFTTITFDGIAPDSSEYKLGIGLGFVYKQALSPSIQAFVDYLKTKPAHSVIRQTGHVPTKNLYVTQIH